MNDLKALKALKNKILSLAMQGKLLKQNENDEPASVLLEKIKLEKETLLKHVKLKKEKPLPPINADEVPYKLPNSWQWVRLGEVCEISLGKTPKRDNKLYWNNGVYPWIKIGDMTTSNKYIYKTSEKISELAFKRIFNEKLIPKGSLIFSFKLSIGKVCILGMDALTNEAICTLKLYSVFQKYINYLYYILPHTDTNSLTNDAIKGKTLNSKTLPLILLPLPPLAEQERIVAKIEEIFAIIDEIEKNITENKKISKILYNRLLSHAMQGKLVKQNENDEPASVLLEKIKLEKNRLKANNVKNKGKKKETPLPPINADEVPYKLPNSWQWVRLGEVCEISLGKTPKRDNKLYWNNGVYPWIKIGDMTTSNKYIYKTSEKISELAFKRIFNEKLIAKGSLIFSFKLSIGKVCILGMDALTNEAICTLKLYSVFQKYINYLYYILPHTNTNSLTNDAIKGKTLNSKTLPLILLPLPPLAEQERIVAKIEEIKEIIDEIG